MNRRGFVYVFAISVTTVLILAGSSLLLRGAHELSTIERHAELFTAFHLADGAVDHAIENLRNNVTTNIAKTPVAGGSYQANLKELTLGSDQYQILSQGQMQNEQRQLEVIVNVHLPLQLPYGVQAASTITMARNNLVDSYDSQVGLYGEDDNILANGDVATNGTGVGAVSVGKDSTVNGDVFIGVGGNTSTDVTLGPGATISGNSYAFTTPESLTPEEFSGTGGTDLVVANGASLELGGGTHSYTSITLGQNATVTVTDDATFYVKNAFTLNQHAEFITNCGGTCQLTIMVEGGTVPTVAVVTLHQGSLLSAGNDPTLLTLHVTGEEGQTVAGKVQIDQNNGIYGTLYAPLSTVDLDKNALVYGAVIGYTINMAMGATVHYDEALLEPWNQTNPATVSVLSWREL